MKTQTQVNGYGMTDAELQKLVDRENKWKLRNQRNKVAAKLLKAKVVEAGIVVTEKEIDEAIAQQEK